MRVNGPQKTKECFPWVAVARTCLQAKYTRKIKIPHCLPRGFLFYKLHSEGIKHIYVDGGHESWCHLASSQAYSNGLVQLRYEVTNNG